MPATPEISLDFGFSNEEVHPTLNTVSRDRMKLEIRAFLKVLTGPNIPRILAFGDQPRLG